MTHDLNISALIETISNKIFLCNRFLEKIDFGVMVSNLAIFVEKRSLIGD